MPRMKCRFKYWVNEGAFLHEPWLTDTTTGIDYRYDQIPPKIAKALATEMLSGVSFDKKLVELLCHYVSLSK